MRCKCGTEFNAKGVDGVERTCCPICRTPISGAAMASSDTLPKRVVPNPYATSSVPQSSHVQSERVNWVPPPGLKDHCDQRVTAAQEFPWAPPPEIGTILSADSNIWQGRRPNYVIRLVGGALVAATIFSVLVMGVSALSPAQQEKPNPVVIGALAAFTSLVGGLMFVAAVWPALPSCTYIGSEGAACFTGRWKDLACQDRQIAIYSDTNAIYCSKVHHYKDLVLYQGTSYSYHLVGEQGKRSLLYVEGYHYLKDNTPVDDQKMHFAIKVEKEYSERVIKKVEQYFMSGGTLSFRCREIKWWNFRPRSWHNYSIRELRLSLNQLQIVYVNQVEVLDDALFPGIGLDAGIIHLRPRRNTWFRPYGKQSIEFQHLENAYVFMHFIAKAIEALNKRY